MECSNGHPDYVAFLKACNDKLITAQMIRQNIARYRNLEQNELLFADMAEDYTHSYANADYLHSLGFCDADLLSVIYRVFDRSLRNVMLNRPIFVWNKSDLLVGLKAYFHDFDRQKLQQCLDKQCCETQISSEDYRMLEVATTINCFNRILETANGENLDWMAGYGAYISSLEQEMCRFWYSLPKRTLDKLAKHIVDAFYHGFISQSRFIANRNNVRIMYAIGQEALAQQVVQHFKEKGMEPIILQPSSFAYSQQCTVDHQYDNSCMIDPQCYKGQTFAYELALERYRDYIEKTCGFVQIGTFGGANPSVIPGKHSFRPSQEVSKMYQQMLAENRRREAKVLRPDSLSFCSVVFPDSRMGDEFEEIFEEFSLLNTQKSEPYELIQKTLIEILDLCDTVKLKGMNGNQTDLTVSLFPLVDSASQTNFLNCGGDLNIPHGEIFTTPRLAGTNGVLHTKEVYLKDKHYKNLRLEFDEGKVSHFSCSNFEDSKQNYQYVLENLLNNIPDAPMGELSIGTNTLAYKTACKYNLFSCLPILLAEKMGPHIAVGDPCFARGEDSPVFNLYGGKEMVARQNEITMQRNENPDCYANFHTDITIPFDEMGLFVGIDTKTGMEYKIIEDGRFVPEEAKKLNEGLGHRRTFTCQYK